MGLSAKPPAYNGYQPVNGNLEVQEADLEQNNVEHQDTDLERSETEYTHKDEDECCMITRMCIPYLYRLSMAAIAGVTMFGITWLITKHI